jgi:hypothetical protein
MSASSSSSATSSRFLFFAKSQLIRRIRRLCVCVCVSALVRLGLFLFLGFYLWEEEETVERVTYLPHLCLLRVFVCWCRTNVREERYPFVSTVQDLYRPRDWECWRDTHRDRDTETQRDLSPTQLQPWVVETQTQAGEQVCTMWGGENC